MGRDTKRPCVSHTSTVNSVALTPCEERGQTAARHRLHEQAAHTFLTIKVMNDGDVGCLSLDRVMVSGVETIIRDIQQN